MEVNSSPQKTAQPSEQNEAWNGIPEQDAFLPMPRSGDVDLCHSRFQNQFLTELRHRATASSAVSPLVAVTVLPGLCFHCVAKTKA